MKTTRLDRILVEKGLATNLKQAAALTMAGRVFVDGRRVDKPGTQFPISVEVELRAGGIRYVSRGGLKLEAALEHFGISVEGSICADLGSSTGGFTDCLLQRGAALVYAFDVGRGQLDWQLQNDSRVILREGVNVRFLQPDLLEHVPDLIVIDLSFISLMTVLPAARRLGAGRVLALVKPQFEAEREEVGPGGLIRSEILRRAIVDRTIRAFETLGWEILGTFPSPVRGQKGNQEYFVLMRANPD